MIDFYLLSVIVFVLLLIVSIYADRGNIKREGVVLLRRTQRGRATIIKIGNMFPRFWKIVGMLGIFVGFYFSIVGFLSILQLTITNLVAKKAVQGMALLLPSPTSETIIAPGVIAPPFWYFIISIVVLIIVHEGMHGIIAARDRVKIKTLGLILLLIIPGAFVDIDEKQLRKEKHWKQMRIFAAGSFGNFVVAVVSAILLIYLSAATQIPAGVEYTGYIANYSAHKINLTGTIIRIENHTILNITDMENALKEIGPNKTIRITTLNVSKVLNYTINTTDDQWPNFTANILIDMQGWFEQHIPGSVDFFENAYNAYRTFIGAKEQMRDEDVIRSKIQFWNYTKHKYPVLSEVASSRINALEVQLQNYTKRGFIGIANPYTKTKIKAGLEQFDATVEFLLGLLGFLFFINLGVGIVNLLPLWITDGARMWELVFMRISKKKYKKLLQAVSYFVLLMILLNFVLPYKPF